ncbi:MAG: class II aldolase/adducin family protein [Desulfobacterota bacterium]|nr:class II aldolase/adducin family protein [Thermodesulfobacteriota bacterium]
MMFKERQTIVAYGRRMLSVGLTVGTGGNLSIRCSDKLIAISPSGVPYETMRPSDVPVVDISGHAVLGKKKPSSELPMHLAVYQHRQDINALVHTHSRYATALSCARMDLPPIHYTIGFAGSSVRCAPYALYGTAELAEHAVTFMGNGKAVLLANHGVLAGGATLGEAFMIAQVVEYCAELFCLSRVIGTPHCLSAKEMQRVIRNLTEYGQPNGS